MLSGFMNDRFLSPSLIDADGLNGHLHQWGMVKENNVIDEEKFSVPELANKDLW